LTTTIIAAYAAVVATGALAWEVYKHTEPQTLAGVEGGD
jgi:hypothetical protein